MFEAKAILYNTLRFLMTDKKKTTKHNPDDSDESKDYIDLSNTWIKEMNSKNFIWNQYWTPTRDSLLHTKASNVNNLNSLLELQIDNDISAISHPDENKKA